MQHDATRRQAFATYCEPCRLNKVHIQGMTVLLVDKFMNQNLDVKWLRFTKSISHKTVQLQYAWGQEGVNMALRE